MSNLKLQMQLKQTQQLVMTPQLQQAIKLLQLSRMELLEMVNQELLENPVLDEAETTEAPGSFSIDRPETPPEEKDRKESDREEEVHILSIPDNIADWEQYLESNQNLPYFIREEQEKPQFEAMVSRPETLSEHLEWQLTMTHVGPDEVAVGNAIIGNLDENGYLVSPIEEIMEHLGNVAQELGPGILEIIQGFDPPGVGARNLEECLMIQVRQLGLEGSLVEQLVVDHLDAISKKDFDSVARSLQVSKDDVIFAYDTLKQLEPKPGRPFGGTNSIYITPDVFLFKMEDEWVITLNDDGMPKLRINSYYRELLKRGATMLQKDREFLLEKIRSASWLIKSIDQRQRTIYKVTKSILEKQRAFFEQGVRYLKPMVLRDIAEDIDVHESTVSRVTTQKYLQCPQGLYELKYFFNPGIQTVSGEMIASESVRAKIRDVIGAENPVRPLSDQAISDMLKLEGINIARRTVAKYREAMGLLPSSRRKNIT